MKIRKVYLTWLISYLLVLFIPLWINIWVQIQSRQVVESEVDKSNSSLLRQLQQNVDNQIKDIQQLSTQIVLNPQINSFLFSQGTLDVDRRLAAKDIIDQLAISKNANGLISDLFLYFTKDQIGLTSSSLNDTDTLYQLFYENSNMDVATWTKWLNEPSSGHFFLQDAAKPFNLPGVTDAYISYTLSMPIYEKESPLAKLVIILNNERMEQSIQKFQLVNEGSIVVVDESRHPVLQSNGKEDLRPLIRKAMDTEDHSFKADWNGKEVAVSSIRSDQTGWTYIAVVPSFIYGKSVHYVNQITLWGTLLGMIIGLLAIYLVLRKNYNPIRQLVQFVQDKTNPHPHERVRDELELIKMVFSSTFSEREAIRQKLQKQSSTLRNDFLAQLIKGRIELDDEFAGLAKQHNVHFSATGFAVLVFQVDDFSGLFDSGKTREKGKSIPLVNLIMTNIIEETIRRSHEAYMTEIDGRLVCLVNMEASEQDKNQVADAVKLAHSFIRERFSIHFTTSLSRVREGIGSIPDCYAEAVHTIEYKIVLGKSAIIHFEDVQQSRNEIHYPIEKQQQLIRSIRIGDYDPAAAVIDELFHANIAQGQLSVEMGKCLMFNFIGTMVKAMEDIPREFELSFSDTGNAGPLQRLFQCGTLQEMHVELLYIVKEICLYVEENKKSHNINLKDELISYVETHYQDADLNVNALADIFSMNRVYISSFFREQTGEGLPDFINRVRIRQAKDRLIQSSLSIAEIGESVGFQNTNTFIRVFKKFEGITPGQFRQLDTAAQIN